MNITKTRFACISLVMFLLGAIFGGGIGGAVGFSAGQSSFPLSSISSESGGLALTADPGEGISLVSKTLSEEEYGTMAIAANAESVQRITATVTPADAADAVLDWSVSWKEDPTGEKWLGSRGISYFITVTPTSDGALEADVACLHPFGEQIVITASIRGNASVKGTCTADYIQKIGFAETSFQLGFTLKDDPTMKNRGVPDNVSLNFQSSSPAKPNTQVLMNFPAINTAYKTQWKQIYNGTYKLSSSSSAGSYANWTSKFVICVDQCYTKPSISILSTTPNAFPIYSIVCEVKYSEAFCNAATEANYDMTDKQNEYIKIYDKDIIISGSTMPGVSEDPTKLNLGKYTKGEFMQVSSRGDLYTFSDANFLKITDFFPFDFASISFNYTKFTNSLYAASDEGTKTVKFLDFRIGFVARQSRVAGQTFYSDTWEVFFNAESLPKTSTVNANVVTVDPENVTF